VHETLVSYEHNIRLRTLDQADMAFLYDLCTRDTSSTSFRFRGSTPDFRTFGNSLWEGILAQYIVADLSTGERLGLVCLYNASMRDGWAYVGAFAHDNARSSGRVIKAVDLLCAFGFEQWPFRKLYIEATEDTLVQFGRLLDSYFTKLATIEDHAFQNGRYQALTFFAVTRDEWEERSATRVVDRQARERTYDPGATTVSSLSADEFCDFIATTLTLITAPDLGDSFSDDLGLDSLDLVVLEDAILDLVYPRSLELPEKLIEVRDLYNWYCTVESMPVGSIAKPPL
jgi:hypothetical protein